MIKTDLGNAMQQVVCNSVLVPMARLLADPVEKCREGSLTFFTSAAEVLPDPASLLSSLLPAITERMGDFPVIEPGEELRLAIIRLVAGPVILRSGTGLLPYLALIVKVVCRALEDPFHDIKKVRQLLCLVVFFCSLKANLLCSNNSSRLATIVTGST